MDADNPDALPSRGMSRCARHLSVHADPGTEPWVIHPEAAARLACWIAADAAVRYHRRDEIPRVWAEEHDGEALPVSPWSFRAWSRDGVAHLFVDRTETPASAAWLLVHELAHLDLVGAPLLRRAYRGLSRPSGYLSTDEGHEAHPEEQLANLVADQILPRIGYPAGHYDRLWWRRRVCRMGASDHRCPSPVARSSPLQ